MLFSSVNRDVIAGVGSVPVAIALVAITSVHTWLCTDLFVSILEILLIGAAQARVRQVVGDVVDFGALGHHFGKKGFSIADSGSGSRGHVI